MNTNNKSLSTSNVCEIGKEGSPATSGLLRSKRMRDENLPAELEKFKIEMREMFNSFMASQKQQMEGIIIDLKDIQQTNYNIESSITLLTSQNEELQKKLKRLNYNVRKIENI